MGYFLSDQPKLFMTLLSKKDFFLSLKMILFLCIVYATFKWIPEARDRLPQ